MSIYLRQPYSYNITGILTQCLKIDVITIILYKIVCFLKLYHNINKINIYNYFVIKILNILFKEIIID